MSQKTWPFFVHLTSLCPLAAESAKGPLGRLGARAMHKRLHNGYLSATCMVDGFEHVLPEKILELAQV